MTFDGLNGIEKAAGLTPAQSAAITRLLKVRRDTEDRNEELRLYYEGKMAVDDYGIVVDGSALKNDQACYWPEKAVTSLAERERFDGFVFEDGYVDEGLEAVVVSNNMANAYKRHVNSKLMHGVMFACANMTKAGPQVRFHSAQTAWAEPDGNYDTGEVGCGMAVARYGVVDGMGSDPVPVQANFYERGAVTVIERTGAAAWTAQRFAVPYDGCTMFAFVHKSTGTKPFGQSRITPFVRSLTRNAMRTSFHMQVSGAFYAAPKYAALGLTDAQFDAMIKDKPKFYVDTMMLFTRDKDGNVPTLQKFDGSSPEPFIQELKYYASQFSGATGVPLSSLGVNADQPTSSEAMAAAREELVIAARDDIDSDMFTLRKMALLLMAMAGNTTVDRLTDEQLTVQAHFLPPDMPSAAAMADATLKEVQAFPWYADTEVALEHMGHDSSEIMRMRRARDAYKASASLDALMARIAPQQEQQKQVDEDAAE